MSEGPSPGTDAPPNPFSFKNFVKRASASEPSSTTAGKGQRSSRGTLSGRKGEEGKDPIKKKKKKPSSGEGEELPFPDLGTKSVTGILCLARLVLCINYVRNTCTHKRVHVHESSSLTRIGPNQHLLAPQTHNPFFPSDYCHLASLMLVQLGIHQS